MAMSGARKRKPSKQLQEREARIDAALERRRAAAVEAGRELEAIRLDRLYESRGYSSFDAIGKSTRSGFNLGSGTKTGGRSRARCGRRSRRSVGGLGT